VNGVIQPSSRSGQSKETKSKETKKTKSNTKPFSGNGRTTGGGGGGANKPKPSSSSSSSLSTPVPATKVVRREDFTELSPEAAVPGDAIFEHVTRNSAFDDEDAAYGLQMGFRNMRQQQSDDGEDEDIANLDAPPSSYRRESGQIGRR
jgi:hypothetical protein